MVYLSLIMGPMFSRKSSTLIKYINTHRIDSSAIQLVINHASDNRYNENRSIVTHNHDIVPCQSISTIGSILGTEEFMISTHIYIDEGQFFPDLYESVLKIMLNSDKQIYIAGLDSDYMIQPFTHLGLLKLVPLANCITKLNAKCYVCQEDASYTMRSSNSTNQILIGTSSDYQPVCFKHHNKLDELNKKI